LEAQNGARRIQNTGGIGTDFMAEWGSKIICLAKLKG
jgi:hypothetical protein